MAVFLLSDIENSTPMWEAYPAAMAAALSRPDALLAARIAAAGGRVVKHLGDGVFAVFDDGEPLAWALDIRTRLTGEDWGPPGEVRVRMALHAGPA